MPCNESQPSKSVEVEPAIDGDGIVPIVPALNLRIGESATLVYDEARRCWVPAQH